VKRLARTGGKACSAGVAGNVPFQEWDKSYSSIYLWSSHIKDINGFPKNDLRNRKLFRKISKKFGMISQNRNEQQYNYPCISNYFPEISINSFVLYIFPDWNNLDVKWRAGLALGPAKLHGCNSNLGAGHPG
jgi:hypothetical protein